jgi:hypothetical protein
MFPLDEVTGQVWRSFCDATNDVLATKKSNCNLCLSRKYGAQFHQVPKAQADATLGRSFEFCRTN